MEVDLAALRHNYRTLRACIGPDLHIIPALKGNAMGHGIAQIARCLAQFDIHSLAVSNVNDAFAIRNAGVDLPVLMFGGTLPAGIPTLLEYGLTPTVYDLAGAEAVSHCASRTTEVYVKVDAGLGRLGVALPDALEFICHIATLKNVQVAGVYTHVSFYDLAGNDWSRERLTEFDTFLVALERAGINVPISQANASSGLLSGITSRANTVCPGHLLFGISSVAPEVAPIAPYRPVLSAIKSRIIHVALLKSGMRDAPGANAPSRVGVIPLGLADGYRPLMLNASACVLIGGRRAPIKAISLEHMTLDLSDFEDTGVGDEVVLLGKSGKEEITIYEVASWQGTRSHHVMSALDRRLACRYIDAESTAGIDLIQR